MRTITSQKFNEWVEKYYNEFIDKCHKGDFTWLIYGANIENDWQPVGEGVIIISTKNGKSARSRCHKDDKWNVEIGLAVAYARYMGVEIPRVEKTYLVTELVGKEIIIGGNKYYITPYGDKYYMYAITEFGVVLHLSKARVVFESEIVAKGKK